MSIPLPCPTVNGDRVDAIDWSAVRYPWVAPMAACAQDPEYHAEGDVWTHTRMVCDELVALDAWRSMAPLEREVLFAAGLLHDVAKPITTRIEQGRIRHPNHSARGAVMARRILWEMDVPFAVREQVTGLIRHHQAPYFLMDEKDPVRKMALLTQTAHGARLGVLAEADIRGRICHDRERLLDNVTLYREYLTEQGCLELPFGFASDHSRFLYFRTPDRDPTYEAYDDTRSTVTVMSGLPGAGKSHWLRENVDLPVISLDDLRAEMRIRPGDDQGRVAQAARERARVYLRCGESFAWDATNLSRTVRGPLIELFASYRARVRIVYVEAPQERLFRQNRARDSAVPEVAMERMLRHWEVPDITEAHEVLTVVQE